MPLIKSTNNLPYAFVKWDWLPSGTLRPVWLTYYIILVSNLVCKNYTFTLFWGWLMSSDGYPETKFLYNTSFYNFEVKF